MAFAGLKKSLNKANQFVSEKIGGVKGTELEEEFVEMERKTDVAVRLVDDTISQTQDMLQPNAAARARLWTVNSLSRIRGQETATVYPQPEDALGDAMLHHGRELGEEAALAPCLAEAGAALKRLAESKRNLESSVKNCFLDPLHQLREKELKEVAVQRKKLAGRRLDYDYQKRQLAKTAPAASSESLRLAEDKFTESTSEAAAVMTSLLENDVEQIQLDRFAEALLDYHRQCAEIMKELKEKLDQKRREIEMERNAQS